MKLFDTRRKIIIFTVALVAAVAVVALAITLPLVLTRRTPQWTHKLPPETPVEIDVTSPAITLPEKPAVAPTRNTETPTIFGTASASNACYTLEQGVAGEKVFAASYNSEDALPSYAYVYVPVTNYNGNGYLKIKANCASVERIAILAVYYEQYDDSRPAVAVYNSAVMEGDNLIVCDLAAGVVLNSHYGVALNEKLCDKTICGFMLMIDSNPKQVIDEYSGSFTVTEIAVVDDSDPELSILNSAPFISGWKASEGYVSCDIATSRPDSESGSDVKSMDAVIDYSVTSTLFPRVEAAITNYNRDYTTVKMDVKGENVKTLTVALKYSMKTSADSIEYNYLSSFNMSVGSDWETLEFDFSTLEELASFTGNTTVPGSYVKNLNPTAIYFFIDAGQANSGRLSVRNVTFSKPEEGGKPRVTSTWTLGAQGITKSGVVEGGIGTLNYDKWQNWNPVTINVASYNSEYSVLVVRVKFYSEYSNLGISLGYGSDKTVILQSNGMTPEPGFNVKLVSHTQENGEDENGAYTFHTFTIDFTDASAIKGGNDPLAQKAITKIMLFIDAGATGSGGQFVVPNAGANMSPARQMQFVGIEFVKPQTELPDQPQE